MDYHTRTNPNTRRLTLRLDKTGMPVVTTPRFIPQWIISRFVNSHSDWITTHQQQLRQNRQRFLSDSSVTIFGKDYQLNIKSALGASKVTIQERTVRIDIHQARTNETSAKILLEKFLKNTASHYLVPRIHGLAKLMKVDFKKITLRAQTTRWGSCSSAGGLNFNWKLVHFPPEIIDYVIVHELAHRKHLDHSAKFWQYVKRYDPEYLLHRGWLKRQGIGVV